MATMTTAWGEPDHAESSLLCAEMMAAIGDLAEVAGVTIHHDTGLVDVVIRLPAELIDRERGLRAAWVLDRLAALVSHSYADEGLQLGHVHAV
jgi:hypothetical protein